MLYRGSFPQKPFLFSAPQDRGPETGPGCLIAHLVQTRQWFFSLSTPEYLTIGINELIDQGTQRMYISEATSTLFQLPCSHFLFIAQKNEELELTDF